MSVLMVPPGGTGTGVSLGKYLRIWMEGNLVHGPGDIRGERYQLDDEKYGVLKRAYEVMPPGHKSPEGEDMTGRRRFKRVGISVRKGWAKTELAAGFVAAELHPLAPVRFSHFAPPGGEWSKWTFFDEEGTEHRYLYEEGEPVGVGVKDPYIPMVAFTQEQSEELAFNALKVMLEEGHVADCFDIGNERILVVDEGGKAAGRAVSLAGSPNARDGARTTFQVFDETHRMELESLVKAHQTMLANIPKRKKADAWTLEITTSYEPGKASVAEKTMEYARQVDEGKLHDSRLFFFHRQADDKWQLRDEKGVPDVQAMREAVIEASGLSAEWIDVDGIVELGLDPQTPPEYWERVWLNRPVAQEGQAFPMHRIADLVMPHKEVIVPTGPLATEYERRQTLWVADPGSMITVGFDGSQTKDATALVGTELASGAQWLIAMWENPGHPDWSVPGDEVDAVVAAVFDTWDVWRLYADPYWWDHHVSDWESKYLVKRGKDRGKPKVVSWPTNVHKRMALSIKAYLAAMREGKWKWDGDERFKAHLANSRKYPIHILDEDEIPLFLIRKERPDSPLKMDAAMAGCLSWEAYRDAISAGVNFQSRSKTPFTIN